MLFILNEIFFAESSSTLTSPRNLIAETWASICFHLPELSQYSWQFGLMIKFARGCPYFPSGRWCPSTTGARRSHRTDPSGSCWSRILEIVRQFSRTGAWLSTEQQKILNQVKYFWIGIVWHIIHVLNHGFESHPIWFIVKLGYNSRPAKFVLYIRDLL